MVYVIFLPLAHDPRSLHHNLNCLTFNTQLSNTCESHCKDFIFAVISLCNVSLLLQQESPLLVFQFSSLLLAESKTPFVLRTAVLSHSV